MNGKEIANTIMKQLVQSENTGRLKAMVGADKMSYDNVGTLRFKFKGSKVANWIKISLNSMDLYDVEFIKIHGTKMTIVKEFNNVYNDQLKGIFEKTTGLYLSL